MGGPISAAELQARWGKAREAMSRRKIDLLLVSGRHNYLYFTGHSSREFDHTMRPMIFLLPLRGEPFVLVYGQQANAATGPGEIREARTYTDAPMTVELLVDAVRSTGARSVGAELGQYQRLGLPVQDLLLLEQRLPHLALVDAAPLLWELRSRKSPAEQELIAAACAIADTAWERRVGLWNREIPLLERARDLMAEMIRLGADHEVAGHVSTRLSGDGAFWCDLGCNVGGYYSDIARRAVSGSPTAEQERVHEQCSRVLQRTIAAIRPGVRISDVARAAGAALEAEGLPASAPGKRMGHGLGLAPTEPPSISLLDDTVLAPGMVLTPEPRFNLPDGSRVHLEEVVAVTEDGCRLLSHGSARLGRMG